MAENTLPQCRPAGFFLLVLLVESAEADQSPDMRKGRKTSLQVARALCIPSLGQGTGRALKGLSHEFGWLVERNIDASAVNLVA